MFLLLVFRVDTISAERSALFVKEMSFPQTAPTDDVFFFLTGTGLERVGVTGLDWNCRWAGRWLWMLRSLQKQVTEGVGKGFARSRSDA